jgi:hypothetical protein
VCSASPHLLSRPGQRRKCEEVKEARTSHHGTYIATANGTRLKPDLKKIRSRDGLAKSRLSTTE